MQDSIFSGVGVARILRYIYGGLLFTLLLAMLDVKDTKPIVEALGDVLAPLVALAVGAGIYVIHRYVLGEFILYPLVNLFHSFYDWIKQRSGERATSTVNFLGHKGVGREDRRAAYTSIRGQLLDEKVRAFLDLTHSEIHMLWITAEEIMISALYLALTHQDYLIWLIISIAITICAVLADMQQHQRECQLLRVLDAENKLMPFLKSAGYVP